MSLLKAMTLPHTSGFVQFSPRSFFLSFRIRFLFSIHSNRGFRTAAGPNAVFADIVSLTSGKLANSSEQEVFIAGLNDLSIRALNPSTSEVRQVLSDEHRRAMITHGARDPFGLAIDSKGRLVFSCLEGRTIMRFDPTVSNVKEQVPLCPAIVTKISC
jgi:hypothetical protein